MIADTPLCKLAQKYGTDKSPWISETVWGHNYTPVYYEKFRDMRNSVKKVLEIGIGTKKSMPPKVRKLKNYVVGASLYMWRDFFPNATIYGIDVLPECMVKGDRIETFLVDQGNKNQLEDLIKKIGSDIDLVIDDGSHKALHQVFTCVVLKPLLNPEAVYVIEDVKRMEIASFLEEWGYQIEYKMFKPKHGWDDRLFFVK